MTRTRNEQMLLEKMMLIEPVSHRVATSLQFLKNAVYAECNKMRSVCTYFVGWFKDGKESLQSVRNAVSSYVHDLFILFQV